MTSFITGTFSDAHEANRAVDELIALGYPRDQINVMMSRKTHGRFARANEPAPGETQGANIAKGAAGGGMIGGTLGAIIAGITLTGAVGATVATGGLAAPVIAGPVAAALAGGGAGAAIGSVLGALIGAGLPEDDAKRVAHDVDAGAIVVGVNAQDRDVPLVRDILRRGDADIEAGRSDVVYERSVADDPLRPIGTVDGPPLL